MAWSRKYYKKGYKGYWRGGKSKLTPTRAFKRSAANMTQNGLFNISTVQFGEMILLNSGIQGDKMYKRFDAIDVGTLIQSCQMHESLKRVFDQYRVEKVTLKITVGAASFSGFPVMTCACVDRTGFAAADMDINVLKTYGSYKEVSSATDGSNVKPLFINVSQSDLVSRSLYTDTYNRATFPSVAFGFYCNNLLNQNNPTVSFSVEMDAQVRYRGVRYSGRV